MKARYSGYCPYCMRYISKGKSEIEKLPEGMRMNVEVWADRGRVSYYSPVCKRTFNRWDNPGVNEHRKSEWVHTGCYVAAMRLMEMSRDNGGGIAPFMAEGRA